MLEFFNLVPYCTMPIIPVAVTMALLFMAQVFTILLAYCMKGIAHFLLLLQQMLMIMCFVRNVHCLYLLASHSCGSMVIGVVTFKVN